MAIVGWALIIVGFLFLLIGLVGAARAVLQQGSFRGEAFPIPDIPWGEILKELLKQGAWGICAALGVALIVLGLLLVAPDVFTSKDSDSAALAGWFRRS